MHQSPTGEDGATHREQPAFVNDEREEVRWKTKPT
jgi:hypothetical protein